MESTRVEESAEREPPRIVENYWIRRASERPPEEAVHPKSRFMSYEMWTRRMIQTWTLRRLRAIQPRFRRCVDMGCGYGDWTDLFAAMCDEVHAFDIAPAFVDATKRRVPAAHVSRSDLRSYVLPRDVDFVYLGAVLIYASQPDVVDVLRRVHDALVPGGTVIVRDWCTLNLGRRTVNISEDHWSIHRSPWELAWLAEAAKLRLVEMRASPSIYGEVMGGRVGQWPMRLLWRLVSLPVRRASHTLVLRRER